jgi:hypothetical protein
MTCEVCGGPDGRYRSRWEQTLCVGCHWRRSVAVALERSAAGIAPKPPPPPLDWPEWTGMQ